MNRRKIGAVCGIVLLIVAAVVVVLRNRQQPLSVPEVLAVVLVTEVRVKAVERKPEPMLQLLRLMRLTQLNYVIGEGMWYNIC